ncbi:MAG: aminotransferase class I/II-fold pyridoxal phosphate-dependent enzyme [Saprospiraceae bacterium]|nr:aminotransferase class I/II-fold pyridoxal phosphate-dependent enzyme [Saprospiraceae bacterium]
MSLPKIWLSSPHMGTQEQIFVQAAFDTNWIAPLGPHVDGFEADLCAFTGAKHAAALSAGTAALHLGLILLDVKAGDLVLCQSMTFSASANPIVYQGATPVFIDSEPDTWNMDPIALEAAIKDRIAKGKKPKAIIPVHLYGMPAKMNEILHIARTYEIPVLEDAAEALGSTYHGIPCGTLGDLGVLSFNGNKIITTSSGGALIGKDAEKIQKARFLSTQARDQAPHYQHSHIGYNYRMSNVLAGIGRGQMIVLPERVAQRRSNYERYLTVLGKVPGIQFVPEPTGFFSNRWLTTILVDPALTGGLTRETIRLKLEEHNIESRPLWKPMHLQPVFADCPFYGDGTSARLFDQGLCLPSGSNLVDADFSRIFEVLTQILPG